MLGQRKFDKHGGDRNTAGCHLPADLFILLLTNHHNVPADLSEEEPVLHDGLPAGHAPLEAAGPPRRGEDGRAGPRVQLLQPFYSGFSCPSSTSTCQALPSPRLLLARQV